MEEKIQEASIRLTRGMPVSSASENKYVLPEKF